MKCSVENNNKLPFLSRFFRAVAQDLVIPKSYIMEMIDKDNRKSDINIKDYKNDHV